MEVYNAIKEKYYDFYLELNTLDISFVMKYNKNTIEYTKIIFILDDGTMVFETDNAHLYVNFDNQLCFVRERDSVTGKPIHYKPIPDTMLEFTLMYGRLPQIPS